MRIFDIPLRNERLTDEQYIEKIRKGLRVHRWMRYFHAAIGFVILVLCLFGLELFLKSLTTPTVPPRQQNLAYGLFVLAAVLGLALGLMLTSAAQSLGVALFERRKDRMLVECWDALNALLGERESTLGQ